MITLPTAPGKPTIKVAESTGGSVTHYNIERGPTVRIGTSGVLVCMGSSCRLIASKCEHVEYVRPFHRDYESAKLAAEAGV